MSLVHEQGGQGLVEYASLLMLAFMIVLAVLMVYGGQLAHAFSHLTNQLSTVP